MMLVIFLAVVCLASTSLGATFVPFKQGRCAMNSVRQILASNTQDKASNGIDELIEGERQRAHVPG